MPTLAEIQLQIETLGDEVSRFGTRKEIRTLPGILQFGEDIKGLTSGFLNDKTWLIVCTNRRLLFIDCGLFWGVQQLDIPLEKINSFEFKAGVFFGEFTVWDGSTKSVVGKIWKKTLRPFVNALNRELERIRSKSKSSAAYIDVADQIRKLADLRDEGLITDDEFRGQKKKLLDL